MIRNYNTHSVSGQASGISVFTIPVHIPIEEYNFLDWYISQRGILVNRGFERIVVSFDVNRVAIVNAVAPVFTGATAAFDADGESDGIVGIRNRIVLPLVAAVHEVAAHQRQNGGFAAFQSTGLNRFR